MRHDLADLALVASATLASTAVLVLSDIAPLSDVVRTAIQVPAGLPLVLWLPGYAILTLLLPALRTRPINMAPLLWHTIWAVALSLVVAVTGGLLLNATPSGLTHLSWTIWLATVTLLALAVSAIIRIRRSRRQVEEAPPRSRDEHKHRASPTAAPVRLREGRRHLLKPGAYGLAIVAILGAAIVVSRFSAATTHSQSFAQLWLVPGKTAGRATVGIRNDFPGREDFHLVLRRDSVIASTWNLNLAPGQTWGAQVPTVSGQRLAAALTMPDGKAAPRSVALR